MAYDLDIIDEKTSRLIGRVHRRRVALWQKGGASESYVFWAVVCRDVLRLLQERQARRCRLEDGATLERMLDADCAP